MTWQEYITADQDVLVGKPRIKGTRISVEFVLGLLQANSIEVILEYYPHLTREGVVACLEYAIDVVKTGPVLSEPVEDPIPDWMRSNAGCDSPQPERCAMTCPHDPRDLAPRKDYCRRGTHHPH